MTVLAHKSAKINVGSLDFAAFPAPRCTKSHLTVDDIALQHDRWLATSNKLPASSKMRG
jgi:hypothetical protein